MACKMSYEMHHNFPKIADEAGFTFNTHRPRIRVDWNKISKFDEKSYHSYLRPETMHPGLIDLDHLIREKKFGLIEQHVHDILDCVLESEFDVRILDEGVLKMFRLAQLAVEYQQFCRHYLDRSVHVLREEITTLAQDLDVTKKELREREEEIRKLKRKSKQTYRHTPLPYGNDNIASMILKTLSQKNEIFTSSSGDALQYNKCSYCDKVFMNHLYLKSHMARRHPNVSEIPQRDSEESLLKNKQQNTENTKLRDEILELKLKLKEMETFVKNTTEQVSSNALNQPTATRSENDTIQTKQSAGTSIEKRDAEVITNNEDYVLDRIEEWKKEEQQKYHKEINLLRTQIMESIQIFKEREGTPTTPNQEVKVIDQLNTTISKQGAEILTLKQELMDSRLKMEKEDAERRKENEAQMLLWSNRAETHAKQYESLLQKLNEVAKEAQLSRAQTEAERKRVAQLETLLQQNLNNKQEASESTQDTHATQTKPISHKKLVQNDPQKTPAKKKNVPKVVPAADRQTLEKLHEKAQALLNMGSLSSSSTDTSSEEIMKSPKQRLTLKDAKNTKINNHKPNVVNKKIYKESNYLPQTITSIGTVKTNGPLTSINNKKERKIKSKTPKPKQYSVSDTLNVVQNGPVPNPGSPKKILRAKITEEVNNRLISSGVDPLKNALSIFDFQKQKSQLQKQQELKAKKNPSHDKVRHSILAFLDSNVPKNITIPQQEYESSNKITKAFSLTSVISNVKNKALSFVKSNETSAKDKKKSLDMEVAKKALTMLKTPPDSIQSSPASKNNSTEHRVQLNSGQKHVLSSSKNREPVNSMNKNNGRKTKTMKPSSEASTDSDDYTEGSDHKYYNSVVQQSSKSIENLIKSPARRPLSANSDYNNTVHKYTVSDDNLLRSQSVTNISIPRDETILVSDHKLGDSSDKDSSENLPNNEPEISNIKQTKGVLKNASSTSSLNKKKVLFDMDAIQMKSLSASPSQSLTEKSDGNEKYELGLINLDGEEWDISSIDNEPLKNDTKLQINTRTSPKIAQLKQTIESQLARRNETPSTAIVGGIDILAPRAMVRASSVAGSNTSLGSSILDESENLPPVVNNKAFVKPKTIIHKDDSELDISEFSTDGLISNKNERDAF